MCVHCIDLNLGVIPLLNETDNRNFGNNTKKAPLFTAQLKVINLKKNVKIQACNRRQSYLF
jgi:hypothetical protein